MVPNSPGKDIDLMVWYGITIHVCTCVCTQVRNIGGLVVIKADYQFNSPPIFWLYCVIIFMGFLTSIPTSKS